MPVEIGYRFKAQFAVMLFSKVYVCPHVDSTYLQQVPLSPFLQCFYPRSILLDLLLWIMQDLEGAMTK